MILMRIPHPLLAFVAGSLATLAFAPYGIAWLAIVSAAMLFNAWRQTTPKQAFWRGWCYGLGLFGFGLSWLQIVIYDHGAMPLILAWFITLGFAALLGLLFALQGYCLAKGCDYKTVSGRLLLFPLSWVVFEWLRATLFTGFPWLLLGVSQTSGPLGQLLPYIGIGGTTFVVAACGVGVAMCAEQIGPVAKAKVLALATLLGLHYVVIAAPLWALALFFIYNLLFIRHHTTWAFTFLVSIYLTAGMVQHITLTTPEKTITASLIQVNVPNRLKWDPNQIQDTINQYLTLSNTVWHSDVIVWPEAAIAQLKHELPDLIDALQRQAKQHNTALVLGLPSYQPATHVFHNSLFVLGDTPGEYHKRHLVPFGEYVPLANQLRGLFTFLDLPLSMLSPGAAKQPLISIQGTSVAPFICFETAYSQYLSQALPDAKLLLALSDDSWFGQSIAGAQHLQIGQALAAMGGRDLLHSTSTGLTATVNHAGQITQAIKPFMPGVLTAKVTLRRGFTPWAWLNQWSGALWSWLANIGFIAGLLAPRLRQQYAWNKKSKPTTVLG